VRRLVIPRKHCCRRRMVVAVAAAAAAAVVADVPASFRSRTCRTQLAEVGSHLRCLQIRHRDLEAVAAAVVVVVAVAQTALETHRSASKTGTRSHKPHRMAPRAHCCRSSPSSTPSQGSHCTVLLSSFPCSSSPPAVAAVAVTVVAGAAAAGVAAVEPAVGKDSSPQSLKLKVKVKGRANSPGLASSSQLPWDSIRHPTRKFVAAVLPFRRQTAKVKERGTARCPLTLEVCLPPPLLLPQRRSP